MEAALALALDILVNSVCPGAGLDDTHAPGELRFARRSTLAPLGRAGTVAEISAVILVFLSDAANFITGEDVNVSGGMVMY